MRRFCRATAARRSPLIVTANDFDSIFAMNRIVARDPGEVETTRSASEGSLPIAAPVPTRSTSSTRASAHDDGRFPDLDVIRRSRLKKATLFEMESSPELDAVQAEYMRLAQRWDGTDP